MDTTDQSIQTKEKSRGIFLLEVLGLVLILAFIGWAIFFYGMASRPGQVLPGEIVKKNSGTMLEKVSTPPIISASEKNKMNEAMIERARTPQVTLAERQKIIDAMQQRAL